MEYNIEEEKETVFKFLTVTGEKRKCMRCREKKEKGNGNVFYCNKCKPKR